MEKYLNEACMEALSRLNLSGDIKGMDDELMNDIVESFIKTGYLEIIPWENRQIVRYHDEEKELYIYADNLREVEEELIANLKKER